jgi:hypothetical protein
MKRALHVACSVAVVTIASFLSVSFFSAIHYYIPRRPLSAVPLIEAGIIVHIPVVLAFVGAYLLLKSK